MSCSFCGLNKKLSREHIYSQVVLRLFDDIAPKTYDPIRKVVHEGDPIVKDICEDCNSDMSYLDTGAGHMAEKYCFDFHSIGTVLNFDSRKIKKWCLKTSSNMERSFKRSRFWWKRYWPCFVDEKELLSDEYINIFVGAWENLSPICFSDHLEATIVKILDFNDANVRFTNNANNDIPTDLYSLKIGSLVFLIFIWDPEKGKNIKLIDEVLDYGWENLEDSVSIKKIPFNLVTCDHIGTILDPKKSIKNGQVVDLSLSWLKELYEFRASRMKEIAAIPKVNKPSKK